MKTININKEYSISNTSKTFIVAEMSGNHNQNFDIAVKTIKAMKDAGADAVKLQTYTPDTLTINCSNEYFKIKGTLWSGKTLYDLYSIAYTPWDWQPKLKKIAEDLGLVFFSTPFDKSSVDFLEKMNVLLYKVASFEANDIQLLQYIASKKKPIIVSTGMSTLSEIQDVIEICEKEKNSNLVLLKCTSAYPAPFKDINLKTIPNMIETFNVPVGISDHTYGITVPISAVALGAKVVEKHFILDKSLGGPDSEFSLEPKDFGLMVKSIREAEESLGCVNYKISECQEKSRQFMRSLFVVKDVKKGEKFSSDNVRSIRPGFGLSPKFIDDVIGRVSKSDIKKGTPFSWKLV